MWVRFTQSAEGLEQNKKIDPPWKGNSSCLIACWDVSLFPASGPKVKHWPFLGLELASFWTRTYTVSSPGSQAFGPGQELHIGSPGPLAC